MPWPKPFTSSAPAGGQPEATFGGPVLLGKIKEGGVAGIGPLISPSGALLIQSTGTLTNQTVSTGAPSKAAFLYAPVSTASLITAGPPPYQGYGTATVFVNNTTDQHWEVWSTQDNEWLRFGAVSTVGSGGGSTFAINGTWPEIAVFTSPGGEIGGYSDFTWNETDRILLQGISTASAFFGSGNTASSVSHQFFSVGDNFQNVTSSVNPALTFGYNFALGSVNVFTNSNDAQIVGEANEIGSAGPATIIGNQNYTGPKESGQQYIFGAANQINSSDGTDLIMGFNNLSYGRSSLIIGSEGHLSSSANNNIFICVASATSQAASTGTSTGTLGNYSGDNNCIILSVANVRTFFGQPGSTTHIYNQSSSGTAWGKAVINITSSSAQTVLQAASTVELTGGSIGIFSAGSAGSTGTATVRVLSATSGSTQALPIRFYESTGGNYVGLRAPSTMPAASFTITLPTSEGSTGMVPVIDSSAAILKFNHLSTYSGTFITSTAGTATVVNGIITQIV